MLTNLQTAEVSYFCQLIAQRRLAQLVQSAALTEQRSAVRARYFLLRHDVPEYQKPRFQPGNGVFTLQNVSTLYLSQYAHCTNFVFYSISKYG